MRSMSIASAVRQRGYYSVTQMGGAFLGPGLFVRQGQRVEIAGRCRGVVDPLAQGRAAIDHVDGELVIFIFVREIAPEVVIAMQTPDRLEGERLQPPRAKGLVIIGRAFGMD